MESRELLREYIARQSEAAFAALVERHLGLVYAAARRVVRDPALAQDVAQEVFIQLARHAGRIRESEALAGWLYRASQGVAFGIIRREQRRRRWEAEAMRRQEMDAEPQATWDSVSPLLEEAMRRLKPGEQDALVLRYFENKNLREAGQILAISEDAVQKRVSRALEKLRAHFARCGVATTAVLLAGAMSAHALPTAPAGLAPVVAAGSLSSLGGAATLVAAGPSAGYTGVLKGLAAAVLVVAVVAPLLWVHLDNTALHNEIAAAREHHSQLQQRQHAGPARLSDAEINARVQAAVAQRLTGLDVAKESQAYLSPWFGDWVQFVTSANPRDLPRIAVAVERVPYKETKIGLLYIVLDVWAYADPLPAMACAQAVPSDPDYVHDNAVRFVVEQWAAKDLAAAQAWVEQRPAGPLRDYLLLPIVEHRADHDPQGAFELINRLGTASNNLLNTYDSLFRNWKNPNYPQIAATVDALRAETRESAVYSLAGSWAGQNPEAALAWADGEPQASDRQNLTGHVLETWAETDGPAAAAWAEQVPAMKERQEALARVVRAWASHDHEAALAYAQELPSEMKPEELNYTIFRDWGMRDPYAAGKYVAAMPPGPAQDAAATTLAEGWSLANSDTDQSQLDLANWVATLPADLQEKAYPNLLMYWKTKEPVAAKIWIAQSSLSDQQKANYLGKDWKQQP